MGGIVVGPRQQAINELCPLVWRRIGREVASLLSRGNKTGDVEVHPSRERGIVAPWRERLGFGELRLAPFRGDEGIDGIPRAWWWSLGR